MKLQELFDKPLPWKWVIRTLSSWDALFDASTGEGYIDFKQSYPGDWSIAFSIDGNEEVSGEGDEFKIFSTVVDIIKDFIEENKPTKIRFEAKESSRIKLYNRLAKVLGSKFGYKAKKTGGKYILVRK